MSGWANANRRSRLPADWAKRVAATKRRARGRCQAEVHVIECSGIGAECDHIKQGDDHSPANLQWLSTPCHAAKTRADNHSSKRLTLPDERHPGML